MDISLILRFMVERSASDLFFSTGAPPNIKIEGVSTPVGHAPLPPGAIKDIAYSIMTEEQIDEFEEKLEMNFAYSASNIGRFRVNVFRQRGEVGMVMRHIKTNIPDITLLKLPPVLKDVIMEHNGLILVCGPTGAGKSTTLAAMVDYRNRNKTGHILTIEDPIEYLHAHKQSIIDQREIGVDTHSYHDALRNALREAPDVILIGEIRDAEAMEYAVTFAQTGHLCLATLHANNTKQAFERIRHFYPPEKQGQVMFDLSLVVRGIISQKLIPNVQGKRVPVMEVMLRSPDVVELIQKDELDNIVKAIESNANDGMMTMDQHLYELYKKGELDQEAALYHAESRTNLSLRMRLGDDDKGANKVQNLGENQNNSPFSTEL